MISMHFTTSRIPTSSPATRRRSGRSAHGPTTIHVRLRATVPVASTVGDNDLSDEFEADGAFRITVGLVSRVFELAGADTDEPYRFTPDQRFRRATQSMTHWLPPKPEHSNYRTGHSSYDLHSCRAEPSYSNPALILKDRAGRAH